MFLPGPACRFGSEQVSGLTLDTYGWLRVFTDSRLMIYLFSESYHISRVHSPGNRNEIGKLSIKFWYCVQEISHWCWKCQEAIKVFTLWGAGISVVNLMEIWPMVVLSVKQTVHGDKIWVLHSPLSFNLTRESIRNVYREWSACMFCGLFLNPRESCTSQPEALKTNIMSHRVPPEAANASYEETTRMSVCGQIW